LVALVVAELDLAELEMLELDPPVADPVELLELSTDDDTEADFVLVAEVLTGEDTEPVVDVLELLTVEELPGALYGTETETNDVDPLEVLPSEDDVLEVLTGEDTEADVLDTTEVLPDVDVVLAMDEETGDVEMLAVADELTLADDEVAGWLAVL